MRGAYEVGVVRGIVEALGLKPGDASPFNLFAGTSVGAINAAFLAANNQRGDMSVHELVDTWTGLRMSEHVRIRPLGLTGSRTRFIARFFGASGLGRSLLDPKPLERIVGGAIDWNQLRANVAADITHALCVAALDIGSGRTTMFAELAPGATFRPSKDPRRQSSIEQISVDHVMGSAALPLMFPARLVGNAYYCDGGVRFNTPIAPAIRSGAERLVVISLAHPRDEPDRLPSQLPDYPSLPFLLGKILNALLLDPVSYDLQVLNRFNRMIGVLENTLTEAERVRVDNVLIESRGAAYRRIPNLVFRPSEDIGQIAATFLRENLHELSANWMTKRILKRIFTTNLGLDSDLSSYLLFDGTFATRLIELGRRDALRRTDEIRQFFGPPAAP